MLSQITNFFKRNKKIMYYLSFFAVIYFALGDNVFARDVNSDNEEGAIKAFNGFIQLISTWVGMLWALIGVFLNPAWTNGTGIGLHGNLKDLWIMISNLVYFIFAILIVIIAFMNIIGKWDKWELKQALPKFIVWVLIVPFSWFFVQLILSFSSILSASVLSLPYDTFYSQNKNWLKSVLNNEVCVNYVYIQNWSTDVSKAANTVDGCGKTGTLWDLLHWDGIYSMLSIYTYGIFSADEVSSLNLKDINSFSTLFTLSINTILILLLFIVYFILLISLWLALFVRWIWLWLYMIFSPVFWLLYFFWKEKEGFMEWKFSFTEFIWLAMVPVYVSAALSFWLLFIFVAWLSFNTDDGGKWSLFLDYHEIKDGKLNGNEAVVYTGKDKDKLVSQSWGTRVTFLGQYSIDIYGGIGTSTKTGLEWLNIMKSGVGTLIIQMFWLAVLWIAVMAALWASKITWAVVEPIASFGKQVWGLIAKSPQYAPIFGGQSMSSIQAAGSSIKSNIQTNAAKPWNELADKMFGLDEFTKKLNETKTIDNSSDWNRQKILNEWIKMYWTADSKTKVDQINALMKSKLGGEFNISYKRDKTEMSKDIEAALKDEDVKWFTWKGSSIYFARGIEASMQWNAPTSAVKEWGEWGLSDIEKDEVKVDTYKLWNHELYLKTNEIEKDKSIDINVVLDDKWYKVNLTNTSKAALSQNNSEDIFKKLIDDDKINLKDLFKQMNEEQKSEFIENLFPNIKGITDIDNKKQEISSIIKNLTEFKG